MSLTDYTSYAEVRAVLGVESEEISDTTLALSLYGDHLTNELEGVNVNLPTQYAAVVAVVSPAVRTDVQTRFYSVTRLFAAYAVAKQLGSALAMFGPKDITDGKATVSRFADSPYKATLSRVDQQYEALRAKLEAAYLALGLTLTQSTPRPYFVISSPSTNPVTG